MPPEHHISVPKAELLLALRRRLAAAGNSAGGAAPGGEISAAADATTTGGGGGAGSGGEFDDLAKLMEGVASFDFIDIKERMRTNFLPFASGARNQARALWVRGWRCVRCAVRGWRGPGARRPSGSPTRARARRRRRAPPHRRRRRTCSARARGCRRRPTWTPRRGARARVPDAPPAPRRRPAPPGCTPPAARRPYTPPPPAQELEFVGDVFDVLRASHYHPLTEQEWKTALAESFKLTLPLEARRGARARAHGCRGRRRRGRPAPPPPACPATNPLPLSPLPPLVILSLSRVTTDRVGVHGRGTSQEVLGDDAAPPPAAGACPTRCVLRARARPSSHLDPPPAAFAVAFPTPQHTHSPNTRAHAHTCSK